LLFTCSFGAWLEQPSFLDSLRCKIEVCLISCVSYWLDLFQGLLVQSNQMLRCTTILGKMWKISTSMTLIVIFGFRIFVFSLVWIRPLSPVVFAFISFVLWIWSMELILIHSIFPYIVNLRQRRQTKRALMMILQKKFIMFFYLSQCMNKLGVKLVIMSPVLLL
jgi:hypothetical protein